MGLLPDMADFHLSEIQYKRGKKSMSKLFQQPSIATALTSALDLSSSGFSQLDCLVSAL